MIHPDSDYYQKQFECGIIESPQAGAFKIHEGIEFTFFDSTEPVILESAGVTTLVPPGLAVMFWAAIPNRIFSMPENPVQYWFTIPIDQFLKLDVSQNILHDLLSGKILMENNQSMQTIDVKMFPVWMEELNSKSPVDQLTVEKSIITRVYRFLSHMQVSSTAAKTQSHHSIAQFIMVSDAIRLLLTSDLRIIDIALEAGFESLSSFYQIFKNVCGRKPGEYRRLAKPADMKRDKGI